MPVIQSLREVGRPYVADINFNLNATVSQVTFEILKNNPVLVADVASNKVKQEVLEREVIRVIDQLGLKIGIDREEFIESVFDYMFGYGPLQKYINDEEISDIDGTRYDEFCVVRNGVTEPIDVRFRDEDEFNKYCNLVAIRNYGILNENDSHCRVCDDKYRLRINVSIRPRNITGPCINIRKHRMDSYSLQDLVELDMLSKGAADFLKECVCHRVNIVFGGHGGSGKTTLMRALINEKPEMERVLVCESDAEIFPDKPYCICQRIKRENEGGRIYSLADLVKDGLTLRVETYVIGESVSNEAWEGVKAAHSGHSFMTTTHAMSGYECLERLVLLSKVGEERNNQEIPEVVGKAIDVVVYLKKFRVEEILEVNRYDCEHGKYLVNKIYQRKGEKDYLLKCNEVKHRVLEKLKD